jgi:hypothetical protein
MRTALLFFIIWIVLIANLGIEVADYYSQYRLAQKLENTFVERAPTNEVDNEQSDNIRNQKEKYARAVTSTSFSLAFSLVLGVLFFKKSRKSE